MQKATIEQLKNHKPSIYNEIQQIITQEYNDSIYLRQCAEQLDDKEQVLYFAGKAEACRDILRMMDGLN